MTALDDARAILSSQPFSVLLGAELTEFDDGVATLRIPARPDLLQQFGYAHGGVIAYAIDNAVTFAAATKLGPALLTSGITVSYLRPAQGTITARAMVVGTTRRQAVMRCEVFGEDGRLVASGQGTASSIAERA